MTRISMFRKLRQFRQREDGSFAVEFVILFPLLMLILFTTIELGLIQVRGSMLERSLDLTVRDLRLGTGTGMQHDDIRDRICERTGFIDNCALDLRLEMVQVDPFDWTDIDPIPDCINSVEDVNPVRAFENGQSNELMFIRACYKFDPMFPHWGLGEALAKDTDGRVKLHAASAFVQEPR